jgi:tagatose-6-phosphate ketose/aldose isomerase
VRGRAEERPIVFLVGAGTSDYVGRALAGLLQQQWQCEVAALPSTDLLIALEDYLLSGKNYLWLSFSRSGDSSEGVALIRTVLEKYPRIHHLLVTCNPDGKMAREFTNFEQVYCLTLDDAVNDRGLAMTSSYSNMVVAGQSLAHLDNLDEYGVTLDALCAVGEDFLNQAAIDAELLTGEGPRKICFLGTGALQAVAVESALKVLELTAGKIVSFAESFLGIRHGPLSAIDEETLVVAYLSGDERRRNYELDLLAEIQQKRLTRRIVAVSPPFADGAAIRTIRLANLPRGLPDLYRPPVDVMLGQLLGLFLSLRGNLQPDVPSPTGAISRVVTQVAIH